MNEANDWKVRLKNETVELSKKYNKLQDFMRTDSFYNLDRVNKDLLYKQAHAMLDYLQTLGQRCEINGITLEGELL